MSDTVLLTGVTGFLGGHIAKSLLDRGYHVRGSLRNPDRAPQTAAAIETLGADVSRLDFVQLDLLRDAGWQEAADGARYMVHSASPFVTSMPRDPSVLIEPAVRGTERAIQAAKNAGTEKIVLTSSLAAIVYGRGRNRPQKLGPDDWPDPAEGLLSAYALSKLLAERRAWELVESGPALTVVNPGFIIGPLPDSDPGTSGAILLRLLRGDIPMLPKLSFHPVDVRDLADIHANALTSDAMNGKRVPAGFGPVSMQELARDLADDLPDYANRIPNRVAPNWLIRLIALFDRDLRANVSELGYAPSLDSSRGKELLGRTPRTSRQAVADMASDMIAKGLLK